ncbi:MAG: hypothetical protein Q7T37_00540 [bacterium]|nr:hypothetical protein [bacterium]MDO8742557.1 hypothetical protein [bacterium]
MDPELKRILDETHALARDNHRMLRAIRRDQIISFFGKIVFWILLIILPLYVYQQYLGPIMSKFSVLYGMGTTTPSGSSLPTTAELQKLIDSYKVKQ